MGGLIEDYFKSLFSTSHLFDFDDILSGIQPAISDEMNDILTREFTAKEIQHAFKQMAPTTTLGPDGMPPIFYKNFWNIVGNDVIKTVLNALNSGCVHESLNETFIALIPKIKNTKKVSNFRPISLCNVVYKLISKVVVNPLKQILPNIVFDSQSAFLPRKLIICNVLVAFETLHYLKRKTYLKLDMSKAYDRVEWTFLEKVMRHLGFA